MNSFAENALKSAALLTTMPKYVVSYELTVMKARVAEQSYIQHMCKKQPQSTKEEESIYHI